MASEVEAYVEEVLAHALETGSTEVALTELGLMGLPRLLAQVTSVVQLDLSSNSLFSIPPSILTPLVNLRHLSLAGNALDALSDVPLQVVGATLLSLDLSGNTLSEVSDDIATLTALKHINLANNAIESVSDAIGKCRALITLELSGNKLSELPVAALASLPELEEVGLADNVWLGPQYMDLVHAKGAQRTRNAMKALVGGGGAKAPPLPAKAPKPAARAPDGVAQILQPRKPPVRRSGARGRGRGRGHGTAPGRSASPLPPPRAARNARRTSMSEYDSRGGTPVVEDSPSAAHLSAARKGAMAAAAAFRRPAAKTRQALLARVQSLSSGSPSPRDRPVPLPPPPGGGEPKKPTKKPPPPGRGGGSKPLPSMPEPGKKPVRPPPGRPAAAKPLPVPAVKKAPPPVPGGPKPGKKPPPPPADAGRKPLAMNGANNAPAPGSSPPKAPWVKGGRAAPLPSPTASGRGTPPWRPRGGESGGGGSNSSGSSASAPKVPGGKPPPPPPAGLRSKIAARRGRGRGGGRRLSRTLANRPPPGPPPPVPAAAAAASPPPASDSVEDLRQKLAQMEAQLAREREDRERAEEKVREEQSRREQVEAKIQAEVDAGSVAAYTELDLSEITWGTRLGTGAFGEVYSGVWNGCEVAIKKLFGNADPTEFHQEVAFLSRIRHPNVVLFMAASVPDLCIVTEFCALGSLYDLLHESDTEFDDDLIFRCVIDSLRGMTYLHSCNIIHRDLKTQNLLVDANWNIKVADFGLARFHSATAATIKSTVGTYNYMAPEVMNGDRTTAKADVYSMAICVWELLVRQVPFGDLDLPQIVRVIDRGGRPGPIPDNAPTLLRELISEGWATNPDDRPSFADLLAAFQ
ncbi:TKL protein kinase [Thecamonas trahens ATCC 50062]|uniref:TKL protein kinase n=1 Tax=Thecamonas trahens ATCC 50062 TaxID=461836 RepID=A0A0L0DMW6_THETB|nr:TKL protein kinase [Thecamonas trahens ATCC 50062]KNC52758.1 TKL protein kinase [Thecamonas trahens ATCC 50062]|eukprot:XP_013755071.1 TKL protein kinase [Thecamonas trahens ATCC 50062]